MDFFYEVFMNFLKCQSFGGMNFQWRDRNLSGSIKTFILCFEHELKTYTFGLTDDKIILFG